MKEAGGKPAATYGPRARRTCGKVVEKPMRKVAAAQTKAPSAMTVRRSWRAARYAASG